MKKHIIRSLQIATLAVGVTATALAGAETDKSHSSDKQHENSLCITIDGDTTDATTLLLVDQVGNAYGTLCYSSDYLTETYGDNCHAVQGRVYGASDLRVALVGVGADHFESPTPTDYLTHTDVAVNLDDIETKSGNGAAATDSLPYSEVSHWATGLKQSFRRQCVIDARHVAVSIAPDNISKINPPVHLEPQAAVALKPPCVLLLPGQTSCRSPTPPPAPNPGDLPCAGTSLAAKGCGTVTNQTSCNTSYMPPTSSSSTGVQCGWNTSSSTCSDSGAQCL